MKTLTDTTFDGEAAPPDQPVDPSRPEPVVAVDAAGQSIDLADQIIHLVRSWSYLKAKMASTVDPELSSLFLIGRLVKDGPTRAKDLAEATCADQSTVSRQVAGLVRAGLVERQADPDDGRASILVPTAKGLERLNKHFANRGRALAPLLADWSDQEREQFVELLGRFNSSLESRREEIARLMSQIHVDRGAPLPAVAAVAHTEHAHPQDSTERSN